MKTTAFVVAGVLACSLVGVSSAQAQATQGAKTNAKATPPAVAETPILEPLTQENAVKAFGLFQNIRLPRALTPQEVELVGTRIREDRVHLAGAAARFLANAQENDAAQRVAPILARLKQTVAEPLSLPPTGVTYLSSEAVAINAFMLALSRIEPSSVVVAALEKERQAKTTTRMHQWLVAAAGLVGDERVADSLKQALEQEPDPSLKALLVSAYARSAGKAAIPTLEVLQHDQTITAFTCTGPQRGIASIAHDELVRLRQAG